MVKLGTILEMRKGKKPVNQSKEYCEGFMPYVDIKAFETGVIESYADGEKSLPCEEGDILIVCDGSRSGLVGKAVKGYVGSTLAKVSAKGLTNQYLFYFLQGKYALLNTKKKGTGTPHVNPEVLKNSQLVVPRVDKQNEIVSKIEELFSNLDASVAELQTAKERLKVYRQAVLKQAYSGELTGDVEPKLSMLREYIEKPKYGTSKKCDYLQNENSIAVYRIPNIDTHNGIISHADIKFADFTEKELDGIGLKIDDILIIRSNGSVSLVGRAACVKKKDTKGTFAGYLIRLRIKDTSILNAKYFLYYLQSHQARIYIEQKARSTSGVNNINSDEICDLIIPVFEIQKQIEIVSEIAERLSVCDNIEKTVDEALKQAEAMRQSILKKAFEGRLV